MTKFLIHRSTVRGSIAIPPSKSHTLRAILFASMANGFSEVRHFLRSPDATAMMQAMQTFGAAMEIHDDVLKIRGLKGKLVSAENVIDAGNSGQVLRFVGALAGLCSSYTVLTGDHSIRHNRPVQPLLQALSHLGATAVSSRLDGYAPIIIKGPIQPGHAQLTGEDSQPVSGILIAASFLPGTTTIDVINPGEKPWIDLTLSWLKKLGITISHEQYSRYTISGTDQIDSFSLSIPGDFSSAAFPMAAALITGSELTLTNLDMHDCQGDKKLIDILQHMGAKIDVDDHKKTVTIRKNSRLVGKQISVNDFIDATPILSVIGCFAEGVTEIIHASVARKKESDRLHAIATELKKMGASIEEKSDGLVISHSPLYGADVSSWNDHRIAMSLAIAGLGASGETKVEDTDCVAKTYPSFAQDLQAIQAAIEVQA